MDCSRVKDDGSPCATQALWRPVLYIFPSAGDQHIEIGFDLGLCDEHRAEATLDDFIPTDDAWAVIAKTIIGRGGVAPARDRVELAFRPVPSA